MSKNNSIPSFRSPPLNEVFLGVQYDNIEAFNITTYGELWEKFRKKFPIAEQHLPIEPSFEKIGGRKQSLNELPQIKLKQLISAQLPRAWFISEKRHDLIQIQPNRFIRNWRRLDVSDTYPRYEKHLRPEFLESMNTLQSFYKENGMGELKPSQCEISYINHIDVGKNHDLLSEVFTGWSGNYDLSNLAEIEEVQLNIKHIINDDEGNFVGRLYVKVQPAFTVEDNKPVFLIELTVRGRPLSEGLEGVMNFMDLGREKIVRAFTEMTTKEMHDLWGKEK